MKNIVVYNNTNTSNNLTKNDFYIYVNFDYKGLFDLIRNLYDDDWKSNYITNILYICTKKKNILKYLIENLY